MLFRFQCRVKHSLQQGGGEGAAQPAQQAVHQQGEICPSPVTWQQGQWHCHQQRTAGTYSSLASNADCNGTVTAARENTAQRLPRATGIPGDSPVCPWGHCRVEWSPVSSHGEADQDFWAVLGAQAAPQWLQPQQLSFVIPPLTPQQMAQGPSWLASGMLGVGFLTCASLEWLFNSLSILQQRPPGSLVPCTSLTYSALAKRRILV